MHIIEVFRILYYTNVKKVKMKKKREKESEREYYLEAFEVPVVWLIGSIPVCAGIWRLDQLSCDWSIDRQEDELSCKVAENPENK